MINLPLKNIKMKRSAIIFFFFFLSFATFQSYGQDDPMVKSIKDRFNIFNKTALQEKIFLHIDRSFYLIGETMWFKAYNLEGATNRFLDMSKVAYLEVLDKENNTIAQTKFSMLLGKGNGSLLIPASISSGNYKVRCYTNWMKNFGADYYFETNISVVNPFVKFDPNPDEKKEVTYDVQFFPEGGYLVKDVESKVAFRAVGPDGKGIDFKGAIIGPDNDTIVRFQPGKFGIGNFMLKPQSGTYRAMVTDKKGKQIIYPLPEIQEQGYVMQVTDSTSGYVKVTVMTNQETPAMVYMMAHTKLANQLVEKRILSGKKTIFLINRAQLGEGISHITILSEKLKPVCERLYFKRPAKSLNIEASVAKPEFNTREKVTMNLTADAGTADLSNLSVSVYLSDSIQSLPQHDIASYLFLTSDLKGNIENPAYYFQSNTKETDQELDNMIISHGWRRFKWDQVFAGRVPEYQHLPEFDGHFVFGKVLKISDSSPVVGIDTYLAALDFPARLYVSQSDQKGNIMFELRKFTGPKEITLQTNLAQDSLYKFEVNNPFSKQYSSALVPSFTFNKNLDEQLLTRSINMQTGNAFLPRIFLEKKQVLTDSLAFFGLPDEKYFLDDFTRFPTMEEVLREYVRGVLVRRRQKEFHFRMIDKLVPNTFYTTDPLVLLDGIPIFNINKLMELDPLKIKKIELMNSRYFLGSMSFTGITSFSTYKNDLAGFELDPRVLVMPYEGVQEQREFYSPKYDNQTSAASRIPDFRNLLHWAPEVVTDASGKAQLQFYTSDQTGNYQVVIQGITEKGVAGSKTISFSVGKRSF